MSRIGGISSATRIGPVWTKAGNQGNGAVNPVEPVGETSPAATYDSTQQNLGEQSGQQQPKQQSQQEQPRTMIVRGTLVTINSTPTYNATTGTYEGKLDLKVG